MSAIQPINKVHAYACYAAKEQVKPFEYIPRPLGAHDITVKISHCGICGSDIHHMDAGWGPQPFPIVPGHEIIGTVVEKGDQVQGFEIGQTVGVGTSGFACFKDSCKACSQNADHLCPERVLTFAANYADGNPSYGGYATHVRVIDTHIIPIPEGLSRAHAAPLLCAGVTTFTPLKKLGVKPGTTVAVVGIGGLGHLAVQFAAALGADVTAISHSANKRDEALTLGAKHFIDLSDKDAAKGKSFDVILMTSTHLTALDPYLAMLDVRGTLVFLGAPENNVQFHPFSILMQESRIMGSLTGSVADVKECLAFAAKHGIKPMIEVFDMDTKINDGIKKVRDGKIRYRAVLKAEEK